MQDAAAALPVRLLGPLAGQRALDLCAAPGGKTLQLAAAGAAVVAVDASDARLGAAAREPAADRARGRGRRGGCAGLGAGRRVSTRCCVDAPCTASGTIRRHPDLPFLRRDRELRRSSSCRRRSSPAPAGWLTPGGRLVYCVCSLLPAEGEGQVARFLAATPGARVVPPDGVAGIEPGWVDAAGGLRLRPDFWPERGGMDGFYAACLTMPAIAA